MIEPELRAFLEGGVGIHIGSRTGSLAPNGARVTAVRVEDDLLHLQVYVPEVAAGRVLPDLEANGAVAVVLARPVDDRACQIKGIIAGSRKAGADERRFVEQQWEAFLDNLARIGIPRVGASGWITWPSVVIRMRATTIFEQTPGPQAGALLVPRS
jgi:hypothetical protein